MRIFKINFVIFLIITKIFLLSHSDEVEAKSTIHSFSRAKNLLESVIYTLPLAQTTLYCEASFDDDKNIILPEGFITNKYKNRAEQLEWEHVVPVENFGRTFSQWREGHELCIDKKANPYKGRQCAEKTSKEFRQMEADMYNLYPAIGAVNASRSNYNFTVLPYVAKSFGACGVKIEGNKIEPPDRAKGKIARTYLYMEHTYARYKMSKAQQKLMIAWDKQFPVTQDECLRTKRIEALQANENIFVKRQYLEHGLW